MGRRLCGPFAPRTRRGGPLCDALHRDARGCGGRRKTTATAISTGDTTADGRRAGHRRPIPSPREAADEAKAIIKNAEITAERIRETAEKNANDAVKRREAQATAKIKAAEANMVAELRERAASLAVATATEIITSKLDKDASLAMIDEAAAEIEKLN